MKFLSEDLNYDPCPPYPTTTYTCGMTIKKVGNILEKF